MYLSRFKVQNYKCLVDVDIPLTPFHVIIGENDSGKTSLLEAIGRLYQAGGGHGINLGINPDIDVFHGTDYILFEASWSEKGDSEDVLRINVMETISRRGAREDRKGAAIDGRWGNAELGEETSNFVDFFKRSENWGEPLSTAIQDLRDLLGEIPIYSFDPNTLRIPCAFDTNRRFRIDADGFGLATFLDDILSRNPKQFIQISEDFCERFPQFESVSLETATGHVRVEQAGQIMGGFPGASSPGRAIVFETSKGLRLPASQVSDGAIIFLGLLALAHVPDPPKLLLIEEPENGVYPKRLREMIQLMRSLVEREDGPAFPQIILTTHSPYVLTDFTPEEVTLLSRYPDDPGKGVRARPLSKAEKLDSYGGAFYLGELWYNLEERELFGEP